MGAGGKIAAEASGFTDDGVVSSSSKQTSYPDHFHDLDVRRFVESPKKVAAAFHAAATLSACLCRPISRLSERPKLYWNALTVLIELPLRFEYSSAAST